MTVFPNQPVIQFTLPDGSLLTFDLNQPELTLGRADDNDIDVDEDSISRCHARLTLKQNQLFVEDLESTNGTFINGVRLPPHTPHPVQAGQTLKFGNVIAAALMPARDHPEPDEPTRVRRRWASPASAGLLASLLKRRGALLAAAALSSLAALVCIVAGAAAIAQSLGVFGGRQKPPAYACQQPPMQIVVQGGQIYQLSAAQTAVPDFTPVAQTGGAPQPGAGTPPVYPTLSGINPNAPIQAATQDPSQPWTPTPLPPPLLTTAFLELPFPYDGGNDNFGGTDDQFRTASQRNMGGNRGRINSFIDHWSPLYPAPNDPGVPGGLESPDEPIAKHIMVYWGENSPNLNYSGHPGMDFSTYAYMQATTPVFAAADGVITFVGTHKASGALFIKIKHTVVGVGDFETQYWHLNPDEFFDAMLGREGEFITAGTRIGTMGNTGFSTGHHLHFEVRFDRDRNGKFPQTEAVDPYGWLGSADNPTDPWYLEANMVSNFLWKHPLGTSAQIPANGGGSVAQPGGTGGALPSQQICVPPGSLPPGGVINYSWAPDPDPQNGAVGVSQGCVLNVKDAQGQPVVKFGSPIRVDIPFSEQDIENIDPNTLTIYWQEPGSADWTALPTTLDLTNHIASAQTSSSGLCSLMGKPTKDFQPPATDILISADTAPDGSMYDTAMVSLKASDPSGIKTTYYSLDGGSSWKEYTGPFALPPSGIPQPAVMDAETFGGMPGTFMVLAYSVDFAGNVQNPPAYEYFSIDPSKDPHNAPSSKPGPTMTGTFTASPTTTATATPTQTPTPTWTATSTQTPTPTELVCAPKLTLNKNAFCRWGPSTQYEPPYTAFTNGTVLDILGQNSSFGSLWLYVRVPTENNSACWVSASAGEVSGADGVCAPPNFKAPTLPTPTSTPKPPPPSKPTATVTQTPTATLPPLH